MAFPTTVWHTYPLGVLGADQTGVRRSPAGRLADLVGWLPHVADLGADTVLLGPVFESLSHGYDTVDHRVVDGRLGDDADLDTLVGAAAAAGIGVVLDGAFAYTSRRFWRLDDPAEAEDPWFRRDEDGRLLPWRVDSLVTPDHASAGYQTYVVEVLRRWLDRGVRGWRLDSAWSVPAGFWRRVLTEVRRTHPDTWFLGQVFDDDVHAAADVAGYSSATSYGLMHGIREWLAGGADGPLRAVLRAHGSASGRTPALTFLGNHDVARLADAVPTPLVPAAFALLLTLPGVPATYYGDELGLRSAWSAGGDDALLRPALQPSDASRPRAAALVGVVGELGRLRRREGWLREARVAEVTVLDRVLDVRVAGEGGALRLRVNAGEHACPSPEGEVVAAGTGAPASDDPSGSAERSPGVGSAGTMTYGGWVLVRD